MAATGVRLWKGVDVQVFQAMCGGLLRSVKSGGELVKGRGVKRVLRDEIQGACCCSMKEFVGLVRHASLRTNVLCVVGLTGR